MAKSVGAMPPTWSDGAIDGVLATGDPKAIAQVIANNPRFLDAIARGLANKPKPGVMGPSHAQIIRTAMVDELMAT